MGEIHNKPELQEFQKPEVSGFQEIKLVSVTDISEAKSFVRDLFEQDDGHYKSYGERYFQTPLNNPERGHYEGERAESKYCPDGSSEAAVAAKEKLAEYGMDGIEYHDAEPDFSECAEATVEIDHMTGNRYGYYYDADGQYCQGNFFQADAKCADLWNASGRDGRNDWTAIDVRDWRYENPYSWHERCDMKTMDLVPQDIHGFFKHSGGVAECRARDAVDDGGVFDE